MSEVNLVAICAWLCEEPDLSIQDIDKTIWPMFHFICIRYHLNWALVKYCIRILEHAVIALL